MLESNQNHATITDNGICPTLPASMGMGGGYVPMIVMQRRFSDVRIYDTEISPTLEQGTGGGGNNLPMLLEFKDEAEDNLNRQMESGISRRGDVDAPNNERNRGRR